MRATNDALYLLRRRRCKGNGTRCSGRGGHISDSLSFSRISIQKPPMKLQREKAASKRLERARATTRSSSRSARAILRQRSFVRSPLLRKRNGQIVKPLPESVSE